MILTGGLEAFDFSGGPQEVAAQVEEEEKQGEHRDEDPGDHRHWHTDHTEDLQENLLREQKHKVLISDVTLNVSSFMS